MEKQGSLGHFSTSLLLRPNRLLKRNDFGDRRNLGNESPLSDLRPLPLERVVLSLRFNAFASVVVMVVTVKHNDIKKEINVSFIVIKENDDYVCSTLLCIFAGKRNTNQPND
ncbi:hypothetical protein GQX74_007292 [Glossina fuscipes]|nr:hypothetical protein GQX74_007292 [Glossina fuscipes]